MLRPSILCLFFCSLLIVAGVTNAFGQHKTIKTFPVRTFYEDNGLISNNIFATAQSSSGELWFGTDKGISTFDGTRWSFIKGSESIPFRNKSMLVALPGDSMVQLGFDPNGVASMRLYHQGKVTELASFKDPNHHKSGRPFNAALIQADGKIKTALLTTEFLWLQDGLNNKWQKIKLPEEIGYQQITKLIFYQNTPHLLTTKGLYSYQPNRKKFRRLWPSLLNNKVIVSATTSPDGEQLYLLGNNWLAQCSNNQLRFLQKDMFGQEDPYSAATYYNILATKKGLLIFQLGNSLFLLNPKSGFLEPFKLTNSFSTAVPTSILEDGERNIWFSTPRGVAMLNSLRFATMDKVNGLPDSEISTIFQIDSGTILLGTNLGINVLKDYQWKQKAEGDLYFNNSSFRILDAARINPEQIAIAGNSQGLGILSEKNNYQTKWYPLPEGSLAVAVYIFKGKLLVSTDGGKIFSFEEGRFTEFLNLDQKRYIRKLHTDQTGNLLILTQTGLYRFDGSSTTHLVSSSPQGNNLYTILQWKEHLLLGTINGIYELKNDRIESLADLIPVQRPVYSMLSDKKGNLWMGTDKGVFIFDGYKAINYNRFSGLAGQEVNRNALVEMKDHRIWIGTDRGLTIYDPHYDEVKKIVPGLRLKKIRTNDRVLTQAPEQELAHDQNTLEFVFQALSFYQPEDLEYRYQLMGLEKKWNTHKNQLQNNVRFSSLPSGTYQFAIQARLQDGEWSPLVLSPKIMIASPFYVQWWFISLAVLTIGFVGYVTNSLVAHKGNEKRLKSAINEKKNQVEQSESKFQAIWESMDTSVLICNREGHILMFNPSFCRLFFHDSQSLVGQEVSSILEHSRFTKSFIDSWFQNPTVLRFELELKVGGMPLYLLTTFSYLNKLSPKEPLLVIGLKDISHQKQAEMKNLRLNELLVRQNRDLVKKELELATFNRELLKRQKELQEAMQVLEERNFELDQFVYKTSHDLRAPIASAIGLLNIMKMEGESSEWPRYVDLIMRSLQKQDSFIKAMLNFSKTARATEKPEVIVFEEFIEQCLFDLQYLPGYETISKRVKVNDPSGKFYSDKMKISIILSNILSNSVKYRDSRKTSRLEIDIDVTPEQAQIMISDNGIGINKDYLHHIFDMFYRATERSDGSGLGLYIVKQTVERLGGKIEVTSELGIGSCFKIIIPTLYQQGPKSATVLAESLPQAKDGADVL